MKRRIFALIGIVLMLALTACGAAPGDSYDVTCDMNDYDYFWQVLEEKSPEEWEVLGSCTMLLEGLDTPVVVHMDGTDVVSIDAFGQSAELGESGLANEYHDGYSPVYDIRSTKDAVVIRVSGGEFSEDSILITKDGCHTFEPENGYYTSIFPGEDGTLDYSRTWYTLADFEQSGFYALESCTGRDDPIDYIGGVPDSGTPHALGYANRSGTPFARAFIKYTPTWARSFTPAKQADRNKIAKMKQIPVHELIVGKNLLFVDDSIVRGTQLRETVEFLYENGAKSVHMRSACPPIMYGCKYLNFSRATSDMELISRQTIVELEGEEGLKYIEEYADGSTERGKKMRKTICEKFKFASLGFQTIDGVVNAIGMDRCKLCTYCWDGKE